MQRNSDSIAPSAGIDFLSRLLRSSHRSPARLAEKYRQRTGKEPDWFTTHGDIFAVGTSKLTPFEPRSPNGSRSFPRANHSLGTPQWNHYYVRAIQGEVRLWVNGYEVSGGRGADPASGHLCLESEGAPVEWKEIRLRELP